MRSGDEGITSSQKVWQRSPEAQLFLHACASSSRARSCQPARRQVCVVAAVARVVLSNLGTKQWHCARLLSTPPCALW